MKSEIKNIKIIYKYGAFGNPNKFGTWIYGKRPDGKTVACKHKETDEGGIRIWSLLDDEKENEVYECQTEFSKNEWLEIRAAEKNEQSRICNKILMNRKKNS